MLCCLCSEQPSGPTTNFRLTTAGLMHLPPDACRYPVRQCTAHPVYENFRVDAFRTVLQGRPTETAALLNLGELMFQSHASYRYSRHGFESACRCETAVSFTLNVTANRQHHAENYKLCCFAAADVGWGPRAPTCSWVSERLLGTLGVVSADGSVPRIHLHHLLACIMQTWCGGRLWRPLHVASSQRCLAQRSLAAAQEVHMLT
jgi:hypothetical protein